MTSEYVYFIFKDFTHHIDALQFIGKVGRGTGNRYKSYTTPYGSGYSTVLLYHDNAYAIEADLIEWCKTQGYIENKKTEVLSIIVSIDDTIRTILNRYNEIILKIMERMRCYGDIQYINANIMRLRDHRRSDTPMELQSKKYAKKYKEDVVSFVCNVPTNWKDKIELEILTKSKDSLSNDVRVIYDLFLVGGIDLCNISNVSALKYYIKNEEIIDILQRIDDLHIIPYKMNHVRKWSRIRDLISDYLQCKNIQYRRLEHGASYRISFDW